MHAAASDGRICTHEVIRDPRRLLQPQTEARPSGRAQASGPPALTRREKTRASYQIIYYINKERHHADVAEEHGALRLALYRRFHGDSINPEGLETENPSDPSSQQAEHDICPAGPRRLRRGAGARASERTVMDFLRQPRRGERRRRRSAGAGEELRRAVGDAVSRGGGGGGGGVKRNGREGGGGHETPSRFDPPKPPRTPHTATTATITTPPPPPSPPPLETENTISHSQS
ncbi:hypothetical protein EYF80_046245 [Liparis tanakae]|uniref:Uncharacterized protein n=1 Tax=Liparis tanakae TaxID=230148 RepID=A0A4Z2FT64_9TELE|nr:hypothetical protein EYF80_046245 [Liparis tanakae]